MNDDKSAGGRLIKWRAVWGWLAALLLVALPVRAWAGDVILGRADADASGGWPVALWVRDGSRSHFIVRAARSELGGLPGRSWRPADARALMRLEFAGAPALLQLDDIDSCPVSLGWGRLLAMPGSADEGGDRVLLQHPACGATSCALPAWRIDLPLDAGDSLPLARLLPRLAARQAQWLVLHVASPYDHPGLSDIASLEAPAAWRNTPDNRASRRTVFPLAAARRFPALHTAMLEQAAAQQGLGAASVLMRVEREGPAQAPRDPSPWADDGSKDLRALGLAAPSIQQLSMARLLLHLQPTDKPAVLRLQPQGRSYPDDLPMTLHALVPQPGDIAACRRRLAALDCEAGCTERVAALAEGDQPGVFFPDAAAIRALAPEARLPACRRACTQNKRAVEVGMQLNFDGVAERQRQAWHWVEAVTGRPAADWQTR